MEKSTIELGRIAKPHGVRGEVKVVPHWANSAALLDLDEVMLELDGETRSFRIESARPAHRALLVKFLGVNDRDQAAELRGARVSVRRELLPEPEPGEAYLCDLVGAKVLAPDGDVGAVVEVRAHPSVDTLVIRTSSGALVEQPLSPGFVEEVDVKNGIVRLASRQGLIE